MYVSRTSVWSRTSMTLALALGLTVLGCNETMTGKEGPPSTSPSAAGDVRLRPASYSRRHGAGRWASARPPPKPVRDVTIQVLGKKNNTVLSKGDHGQQRPLRAQVPPERAPTYVGRARDEHARHPGGGQHLQQRHLVCLTAQGQGRRGEPGPARGPRLDGQQLQRGHADRRAVRHPGQHVHRVAGVPRRAAGALPAAQGELGSRTLRSAGRLRRGQIGTSHFSHGRERNRAGHGGLDTDEFDSHVIVHEWGHFFEANLSRSDNPAGGALARATSWTRASPFGEGYGNALSTPSSCPPPSTSTLWNRGGAGAFASTWRARPSPRMTEPGVFSEFSVMLLLYDLLTAPTVTGPPTTRCPSTWASQPRRARRAAGDGGVTTIGSVCPAPQGPAGRQRRPGGHAGGALPHRLDSLHLGRGDSGPGGHVHPAERSAAQPASSTLQSGARTTADAKNRYYVFTGTGGTVSVTASSVDDVGILTLRTLRSTTGDSQADHAGTGRSLPARPARRVLICSGWLT